MLQTKPRKPILLAFACAALVTYSAWGSGEKTFKGVITDSQCALNVHSLSQSHTEMLQSKEAGSTPADCVWYCVKQRGGRFVLQIKNKVYKLDDQNISRDLAAKPVLVNGTLDSETKVIHVTRIEVADSDKPADRCFLTAPDSCWDTCRGHDLLTDGSV
jgi:hypothetical protein